VYLVLSEDGTEATEWGPRLAGVHTFDDVLLAMAMAHGLAVNDEQALANLASNPRIYSAGTSGDWAARAARIEGLVRIERIGLTIAVNITSLGRLTLSVAAALRRAAGRC
jgi:hypothetical protein